MPIALPYILLVIFMGLVGVLYHYSCKDNQKFYLAAIAILVFWVFFAFRGYILGDWSEYHQMFEHIDVSKLFIFSRRENEKFIEPGFSALMYLSKSICKEYLFFSFLCSTINTVLFVNFLRKTIENIPFVLMIYIAFGGLVISTDLMRNSLALFIVLNALPFIKQRRFVPYVIACIIASSFHLSALVFIPLYFFIHLSLPKYLFLGSLLITFPLRLAHISFIENIARFFHVEENFQFFYRAYIEVYGEGGGSLMEGLVYMFIGILVFIYYDKLKNIHPYSTIIVNALIAYLILWMLFGEFAVLCQRITMLFAFGMWIVPHYLIQCMSIENNKRLFFAFMTILCIKYMSGLEHPDFRYENILFGADKYEQRLLIYEKYKNN